MVGDTYKGGDYDDGSTAEMDYILILYEFERVDLLWYRSVVQLKEKLRGSREII